MNDIPRNRGIHIVAGSGSGKSTVIGKRIAYTDFILGVPLLIIDPQGGTIDNFLYQVLSLPEDAFNEVRDSIVYIDMSGRNGYVGQFPIWYRLPQDTPRDVAYRFLDVIGQIDPQLRNAPIWGWNPMEKVGVNVGMILSALGLPITEAPNLLAKPKDWADRIRAVKFQDPDVAAAANYFLNEYIPQRPEERKRDASTFLSKIQPFTHDRVMELMFCGDKSTIDWADVIKNKKAVLLDFRYERDPKFKILWALTTFLEHFQIRGMVRNQPVSVIIDELSFLLSLQSGTRDLLGDKFDDLINRIARNNDLWLTLAHQEMYQVNERMKDTLLSMGTQVIGYTTKQETALDFAARFTRYKPYQIKTTNKQHSMQRGVNYITGETPVYFTAQEQLIQGSEGFRDLLRFEFMVAISRGEGSGWGETFKAKLGESDAGIDRESVTRARDGLMRLSGVKVTPRPVPVREPVFEDDRVPPPPPQRAALDPSLNYFEEPPEPPKKPRKAAEKAPEYIVSPPKPRARSGRKK